MPAQYLLTGVTGGLGAKILNDMLHIHHVPPASIIATSRSESNRERFEAQGLQFRVADYKRPETLQTAFHDVENLLFMSSSERDNAVRDAEHGNVIAAAQEAGVGRMWYVSLALGGFGNGSRIGFQKAHYTTENALKSSGVNFISLRAGLYSDAFPLFLNWYPSSTSVLFPNITPPVSSSRIAFTSRDELGGGIATLLAKGLAACPSIQPQTERNIVLLTAAETISLVDLVGAIDRGQEASGARGDSLAAEYLEPEEWISASTADDEGGKGRAWFEARLVFTQGVADGDASVVDPALETLLGRKPETGIETVERLLKENPGYTWHQNHVR